MSACAHESTPHHHVDVAASVAAASRRSTTLALAALALAAALGLAGALLEPVGWPAALAGAAGWVTSTLAASATLLLASRRGGAGPALVASAVVGALVTVAVAWWIATTGGHPLWAAAGWTLAAASSQFAQSVAWRRTLHQPGEIGEYARDQAVHAQEARWPGRLAWWAVPAIGFGLWTWILGVLPATVLVVAPAAVALQFVLTRRNLTGAR